MEAPAFRRVWEHDADDHAFFRPCGGNIGGCHAPSADVHDGGGRKGIHHDRTGERAAHAFYHEKHVLPNALVPVITMLGTFFGAILGGSVIIEDMFSIPGLGSYVLAAIWGRDYPVIQGYVIVSGTVFLTFNYLVDILCGMLNPSVRKGGAL